MIRNTGAAVPPVAVTGMSFAGIPLQEWVFLVTILWVVLQIIFLIYDRLKGKK